MVLKLKYGYDPSANGLKLVAIGPEDSSLVITYIPKETDANGDHTDGAQAVKIGSGVVLTGVYVYFNDYDRYYYTRSGGAIDCNTFGGKLFGSGRWKTAGYTTKSPTYSDSQANKLIQKIIDCNKTILCNNLICARYANLLSQQQRSQVRGLQERLQARNTALQAEGLTTEVQTSKPAGYAEMSAYLDKLIAGEQIGIATWVVIVIAAVVIAGLGTAAYFAYKSLADEAEKDVKFSKELTRVLTSKLTEEEYNQLLQETKGIATKSRIKQLVGDSWTTIKMLGLAAIIGFIAFDVTRYYMKK